MRCRSLILGCLATLAVAGCSSGGKGPADGGSTTTTTTTTASSSASASSSSSGTSSSSSSSTGTSSSSSASSSGSGSTSSSSSSSSSSGTSGTTGTLLTFPAFCQQLQAPACTYLEGCQLVDSNAGNCGLFGAQAFGCNGDGDAQLAAGYLTFDATQGQACLAAFSTATTCDANAVSALVASCSGIFQANVHEGGLCVADQDCIPPDGGAAYSELFGCDTYSAPTAGCGGICTYGHQLGELCQGGFNGSGCAQGQCVYTAFADAGYGGLCTSPLIEGANCTNTNNSCDTLVDFCDYAFSGNCLPYAQDGGACDRTTCSQSPGACACLPGVFCQLDDATDAGYCAPASTTDGGTCRFSDCAVSNDNCTCTDPSAACIPPTDGGDLGACLPKLGVGTPCDIIQCPNGLSCPCADDTICEAEADGGAQCSPKHGVGGACVPNSCYDPSYVGCACDASQNLFCDPTGTCQVQAGDGGACDPNAVTPCGGGLSCANGICVNPYPNAGGFCSPNSGVYCSAPDVCSDNVQGTCVPQANLGDACAPSVSDSCVSGYRCLGQDGGGGVCGALPTSNEPCDFTNNDQGCRLLLTCIGEAFADGGSASICVDQTVIDGGACDPNGQSCINGYCNPGTSTCQPFLNVGDPCDSNQGNAQCGPKGYCGTNIADGGFMCADQCISGD